MMQTRKLPLNDNNAIEVPAQDYPWLMEWLWSYDPDQGQVTRVENGRTIFLYHELIRRHLGQDTKVFSLTEQGIDARFAKTLPYAKLIEAYAERVPLGNGTGYALPNPYDLVGLALTSVLTLYYVWYQSRHTFIFSISEEGTPEFIYRPREETSMYSAAEEYPMLRDWMYGEWSGEFDDAHNPPEPLCIVDTTCAAVYGALKQLMLEANPMKDFDDMVDFFDEQKKPLDDLVELVHMLVEQYPTPAR